MHGESAGRAAHWRLWKAQSSSIRIASPGATSRTTLNSGVSSATLSEAMAHSVPRLDSRLPITSGRIPNGSRNPSTPKPPQLGVPGFRRVAVGRERDAERRFHVERLRLAARERRTRRRVAAVRDADVAGEGAHVPRPEHVAHVPGALVHVELRALGGNDAGGVLP